MKEERAVYQKPDREREKKKRRGNGLLYKLGADVKGIILFFKESL